MNEIIESYESNICNLVGSMDNDKIVKIVDILEKCRKNNKKVFIFGNGGSATTANHFVCDFGKNTIKGDTGRFKIISLCDNLATITAYGNDFGYEKIFEERLKNLMEDGDVIIAVSTSGNSKNVIRAVQYAIKRKGYIISLTGFDGGELIKLSDLNININSYTIEQVEDIHLMIEHIIVFIYKNSNIAV